jgi:4-hydroxy-tetrahydrodipicolinate reductase
VSVPIIVCGAAGRMGRTLVQLVDREPGARLLAAVEMKGNGAVGKDAGVVAGLGSLGLPITDDYAAVATPDSVALDFTAPGSAVAHLEIAAAKGAGMVIGTTGFDQTLQQRLAELSKRTRVVIAPNMSIGVNVLLGLVATAARALGDAFDPEIVEMHHRMKLDAPSGTALALARSVAGALGRDLANDANYGREGIVGQRPAKEIGIMTLRGGDVVGDHTVVFAGTGERIEITHRAQSRECFAQGAIRAALWLVNQPPGRYDMGDVLGLKKN